MLDVSAGSVPLFAHPVSLSLSLSLFCFSFFVHSSSPHPIAAALLTDPKWEKHHIRNVNECTDQTVVDERKDCQASFYFKEDVLPSTDPTFIVRDPVSTAKARPSQVRQTKQKHAPQEERQLSTALRVRDSLDPMLTTAHCLLFCSFFSFFF